MDAPRLEHYRPLRRIEYDKLIDHGFFAGDKIELLYGLLVPMSPSTPPHSSAVQELCAILLPALLGRATVRIRNPFAALDLSEPEPDVVVVPPGRYDQAHPDRAYLIIEVAESSLSLDRGLKHRLYASCNVPEYWIVNLADEQIEVYRDPIGETYAKSTRYTRGQSLRVSTFPDVEVHVDDVIAPA